VSAPPPAPKAEPPPPEEPNEQITSFFERTLRVEARVIEMDRQVGKFTERVQALSSVFGPEEKGSDGRRRPPQRSRRS
jgi:hypothetical protein